MRAANGAGWSDWRNSAPAGPFVSPKPPKRPKPPAAPASVTVTRDDGLLTASWPAVGSATRYHVTYRAEDEPDWSLAALGHTATSIVIAGVDNTAAYVVGVRAGNEAGWSGWTNSATVAPAAPDAPESVTVTNRDDGSAQIQWTPVEGATSYAIAQSADNGQTWANAQTTGGGGAGAAGEDGGVATTATIGGLVNSETYIFGVSALNAGGASAQTNSAPAPPVEPGPANLTVTRATGGTLTASWDALPNIWNYFVKYSGDRVNWAYSGLIGKGTSHTFTGLDDTQSYTVAVRGLVDYGWTAWTYSAPAGGPKGAPATPRNLTLTRTEVITNTSWTLRADWDDVPFASTYDVELSTDNGATWTRESTGLSVSQVTKDLSSGDDDYKARVRATNTKGTSGWAYSANNLAPNGPPAAPASVTVSRSGKTLTVTWTAVPFAAKYNLNTSDNGQVSWSRAASGVTGTTTTLTVASATKDYHVSVQAENAAGTGGAWRDSAVSRAVALPPAPTGLTVVRDAKGEIDVSWTAVPGAVGYDLSCSDSGYYWGRCGNLSVTTNSGTIAHARILDGRSYTIAVRARNASGGGPWAKAWVAGVNKPHYVWKPAVLRRDSGTALLSWEPIYAEHYPISHYRVYCAEGLTGTPVWTKCLDMAAPSGQPVTVTGTVSGLDDTKAYRFSVYSVNFIGESERRIQTSAVVAPGPPVLGQIAPAFFTVSAPARTGGGGQTLTYNIHCRLAGGEYTLAKAKWDPGVNPSTVTLATVRTYPGCASFEGLIIESVNGIPGGRLYYPTAAAITAITGSRGNGTLTLTWTPPTANPNRPITSYDVECSTDGGATWADCGGSGSLSGSTYTYTVSSGVPNGAIHVARARARTSIGPAPWKESAQIAGWDTPSQIASITAARGSGSITLTWTVPTVPNSGGAISGYDVQCAMKAGSTWRAWADCGGTGSASSGTYTYTTSDAVDATVYKARARARNTSGVGIWRESGDIHTVPGAPTIVTYSAIASIMYWSLPASADRGSGTGGYRYNIYCRPNATATWTRAITGIVPVGTYEQNQLVSLLLHTAQCGQTASQIEVGFVNVYEGARDRWGPPDQIASVTLSRNTDGDSLTLSWTVPASGGSYPVTGYEAECSTDSGTTWASCGGTIAASGATGSARTHSFTVSKYKSYLVRLRATSSHSADAPWRQSASSAGQTLGAPRTVYVDNSSNNGTHRIYPVRWKKPANTGAAETFAYEMQCTTSESPSANDWNACGTVTVATTANTDVNSSVQHGWAGTLFESVRVRTSKDGVYSAWVIGNTQYHTAGR